MSDSPKIQKRTDDVDSSGDSNCLFFVTTFIPSSEGVFIRKICFVPCVGNPVVRYCSETISLTYFNIQAQFAPQLQVSLFTLGFQSRAVYLSWKILF